MVGLDAMVFKGFLHILIHPRRLSKFGIMDRILLEMLLRLRQL